MRRRSAFTLLEVLLAMVIALMVLGAVYSFVGYQLKQAQAGREVIERTTLSRAILGRIDTDVRCTITLNDPGRFRIAANKAASATASASAGASTTPAAASSTTTPSTASSDSGNSTSTTPSSASGLTPVLLPLGVFGSSSELNLIVSRLPSEIFGDEAGDSGQVTSDLRRISYWMGGDNGGKGGLCRREVRLITSDDASGDLPTGEIEQYLYAGEVQSVEFGYFDGTAWQDTWDSTTLGPDQATPRGSPRAISIKIGISAPSAMGAHDGKEPAVRYFSRTIQIMTANGTPLNSNPEGGTTAP